MKRLIALFLCYFVATLSAHAQSLSGVHLGDTLDQALATVGTKPANTSTMGPFRMFKWHFDDGNDLSITVSLNTGKVVYAESDWNGASDHGTFADFPGMMYGKTTLYDIRERFGSNGMAFRERDPVHATKDGIVSFNAYDAGNAIVTFVTMVKKKAFLKLGKSEDIGSIAYLIAISISDASYAAAWGKRVLSDGYKPIEWK